jgi:transposase
MVEACIARRVAPHPVGGTGIDMTTPNGRMADGMLGRDGMVPRWRQLRPSAAHQPAGSRDGEAVGMLADRRDELGRARTQTVDRLHRLLLERLPGGAKKYLSARQARALVATVKPRDVVGKTRRRLAVDLIGELEAIDKKIKSARTRTSDSWCSPTVPC